ncbi:MAG: xanthine dehydrogenase family protein subunit M [Actinobacteria bacterium]|nr:xanthine dehydrogenase family protein subunit M [Actinomycetota bacterium]
MKPASFEYVAPATVPEALHLLADDTVDSKVLAGGQSLIPLMNLRLAAPERLIDINNLRDLAYIRDDINGLHIGAMTRHTDVLASTSVRQMTPLLHEAAGFVAHSQVRNRGTLGGTLAHADAAAEIPVALLASNAVITARSIEGERQISVEDFFQGYFSTTLRADELIVDVFLPAMPPHGGSAFNEFSRRRGDYAIGGAAVVLVFDDQGICESARVALLAAGPQPVRAPASEGLLVGHRLDGELILAAAKAAASSANPVTSIHGSAEYRRAVIEEMVARGLREATQRAGV